MNHADAAEIRDELNARDYVRAPDDDTFSSDAFHLVRVVQPGYLNGQPMYEVRLDACPGQGSRPSDSVYLPGDLLELVADRGCYLRVDGDTVHIRDWRAGEAQEVANE